MNKKVIILIILILLGIVVAWGFFNRQQFFSKSDSHTHRIGILNPGGPAFTNFFEGFQNRLKEVHHDNGVSFSITYRDAEGSSERLKMFISEMIKEKPDLIATVTSSPTSQIMDESGMTIPVVTAMGDPVEHGYIKSLQTSGTNLTGIAQQNIELTPKRFEILKNIAPGAKRVAVFYDTTCGPTKKARPIANEIVGQLGLTIVEYPMTTPSHEELAKALETIKRKDFDALIFYPHGTLFSKSDLFLKHARDEKLAIIMPDEESLSEGAIASYGPSYYEMGRQMARQAEKILTQNVHPKDIPFEQPDEIKFGISLSTAERLGITIPEDVLVLADRVVK